MGHKGGTGKSMKSTFYKYIKKLGIFNWSSRSKKSTETVLIDLL